MRLRQAFHHMGMGGVNLILTSAYLPHFKRINQKFNTEYNISRVCYCKEHCTVLLQSPLIFTQMSIRPVHAATLSLSTTASCWKWSTSNKSFLKNPMLCPFPKLWLGLKRYSWKSSQNLQNTQNHCYQRIYSHHWNLNVKLPRAAQTSC